MGQIDHTHELQSLTGIPRNTPSKSYAIIACLGSPNKNYIKVVQTETILRSIALLVSQYKKCPVICAKETNHKNAII